MDIVMNEESSLGTDVGGSNINIKRKNDECSDADIEMNSDHRCDDGSHIVDGCTDAHFEMNYKGCDVNFFKIDFEGSDVSSNNESRYNELRWVCISCYHHYDF